ncbi:limonene-1,2-epoxide hydrolase family protein [Rhodococcus sp. (in: high G+C Gram-positive bacteria)]|uniref:limonene-1,2-epoxide hydrolase family protein n=1 Tax=Rhodococcus sp. TaxID=1831 RepID=UPI002586AE42|nr:limonene-1,2-epoxide hydrolase family protein [Rhodococcus sp. (in: high G+C Gram-positive bacteria)]MCX6476206.1 nuclear transport factor 2 family protein [Rhodococcus sp. (in: high G+C Gram-positive bacteria)]
MSSSTATVNAMFAALTDFDVDAAAELMTDDIVWQNVSLPTLRGKKTVVRALRLVTKPSLKFEAEMHHIVCDESTVLTERTDILTVGPLRIEFWVCGTFELRDGKVCVWRDYFSLRDVAWGVVTAVGRAVVGTGTRSRLAPA